MTLDSASAQDPVVSYGVSRTDSIETDYAELSGEAKVKAGRTIQAAAPLKAKAGIAGEPGGLM